MGYDHRWIGIPMSDQKSTADTTSLVTENLLYIFMKKKGDMFLFNFKHLALSLSLTEGLLSLYRFFPFIIIIVIA